MYALPMASQQVFLQSTADALDCSLEQLAGRMAAPWGTFEKWMLPSGAPGAREMPQGAWDLAREILAHEISKSTLGSSPDSALNS